MPTVSAWRRQAPAPQEMRERFAFAKRADLSANSPPGDGYGNLEGAFAEQFTVWAAVTMLRAAEPVLAQRLAGVQPAIITVRKSTNSALITTAWRARDTRANTLWAIRAVTPDDAGLFIDLLCETGGAED
jgi:head-tail adaptor